MKKRSWISTGLAVAMCLVLLTSEALPQDRLFNITKYSPDSLYIKLSAQKAQSWNKEKLKLDSTLKAKWTRSILPGTNAVGVHAIEQYDKGYLVIGWYGNENAPKSWLIKTDINGIVLWNKTFIVNGVTNIKPLNLTQTVDGSIYCAGGIDQSWALDPFVIKLNSCGEREWCKRFFTPGDYDYARHVIEDYDGGCTILNYYGSDGTGMINRWHMIHFSPTGQIAWSNFLLNNDSLARNHEIYNIIHHPDSGYLLTGTIYYPSPLDPGLYYIHPYLIRTDDHGQIMFQEIYYKQTDSAGFAFVSLIDTLLTNIYCFGCRNTIVNWPGGHIENPSLFKMNGSGDFLGFVKIINDTVGCGYDVISLDSMQFILSHDLDVGGPWYYQFLTKTDTSGRVIKIRKVIDDLYPVWLVKTFDGKVLCMTTTSTVTQPVDFDTYLFKFNQNLEDDTIYNQPFVYDYLCPHPISNDTIWCNNCDIVGVEELSPNINSNLRLYPNPANDFIIIELPTYRVTRSSGPVFSSTLVSYNQPILAGEIEVIDMLGRLLQRFNTPAGETQVQLNMSGFTPGLYLLRYISNNELRGSGKLIKR